MNNIADLKPNWISSPSQTISDILRDKKIDLIDFEEQMDYPKNFIDSLLSDNAPITDEIASKLEKVLGASKNFWIRRENQYRNYLDQFDRIQIKRWIDELPLKEMLKNGWISEKPDIYQSSMDFLAVKDLQGLEQRYNEIAMSVNYRTSKTFSSKIGSLVAWIRQGELQAEKINCNEWNSYLFLKTLNELRTLTRQKQPQVFLPKLITECAKCGVAVSIVPNPNGSRVSGATKFINDKKALMILSFRYLSDDHFWFTFFHEAGHLIMNHNTDKMFIDVDNIVDLENGEEQEANIFAGEMLVPSRYHDRMRNLRSNKRKIIAFSQEIGVSPGIVIGQMQHHKIISHNYLNGYKRHYKWEDIFEGTT